jgi:cyclophilin family peptidyl-prolyl cis-trans isomerase
MKYLCFFFLLLVLLACGKKKLTVINPQNVSADLLRYGEENPEKEVLIETDYGNMRLRLYDGTPMHRANFIKNIKEGVYDDAAFYRIVNQFMIQGGTYPNELKYTVPAEISKRYIHQKGALSMARSDENNPGLESSSTEFFIVQGFKYRDYQVEEDEQEFRLSLTPQQKQTYMTSGGYMSLDQLYTTFGEVVEGLEVIDKIAAVKVHEGDKPLKKIPLKISVIE